MNWFNGRSIYRKMMKHPGSPESIGRGVAIGCFAAFFIPFSFQMPVAFLLAVVFRAARILALVFTWISNPLTIAFLYPLQCYIGSYLIRRPLTYPMVTEMLSKILRHPSPGSLASVGTELMASFFAGGLLFGTIAALIGYFASIYIVKRHRIRRQNRCRRIAARQDERFGCPAKAGVQP